MEIHDLIEFSPHFELHTLELPKLPLEETLHPSSPVLKWGRFFSASSDEQLEQLAMADSDINAAKLALDRLSADPVAQRIARDREVAIWNYEAGLQLAREEGEARGEAKGKAEGLRSVLVKLLTLKFRNLPDAVLKRISSAPEDRLELWAERIIPANSLDEVFSD